MSEGSGEKKEPRHRLEQDPAPDSAGTPQLPAEGESSDLDLHLPEIPLWEEGSSQQGPAQSGPPGKPGLANLPSPDWDAEGDPSSLQPPPLIETPAALQKKLERPQAPPPESEALEPPFIRPLMRRRFPTPPSGPAAARMGILGGKASGKSYLLQALIYRTQAAAQSGTLSLYLKGGKVQAYRSAGGQPRLELISTQKLIQAYRGWSRLSFTQRDHQAWYRLAMTFRSGLLGRGRSSLHIDFLDTSGEYREMSLSDESSHEWREAYVGVRVMAFCIPLWAVFPAAGLGPPDLKQRERLLQGFDAVVRNYRSMLERERGRPRVRSLLVLTMADDRRGDLVELTERWITPYLDEPHSYLRRLRRESGVARYLANARRVSRLLYQTLASASPSVARIPEILDFGQGLPWIVPVSAIEGATLDAVEQSGIRPPTEPVPAHVELPLLLTLCETHNILG